MLHSELQSLEPAHAELESLGMLLYPAAPDERVRQLKDELGTLQRRLHVQNQVLPERYSEKVQLQLFSIVLLSFYILSSKYVHILRSSCSVAICNSEYQMFFVS